MTDQRELDALLGTFFVDGTDELADRVIDDALDEIDHTRQRTAWRLPRRFSTMTISTRLVAAAVIGLVAVGGILYATRPDQATVASPSPTPGVSASSGPTASPSVGPSVAILPPRAPKWTSTGDMTADRAYQTATVLQDGRVLVAGGFLPYGGGLLVSAELFDPASGTWTATGSMLHSRPTATLLQDGRVLVAGWDGGDAPKGTELYDPRTGTWSATGRLVEVGIATTATLLRDGRVLATGVDENDYFTSALYDPGTGKWTAAGKMVAMRGDGRATLLADGRVLLTTSDRNDPAALYDPISGRWTETGNVVQRRQMFTATLLADGRVLVAGGIKPRGDASVVASAEVYDPASGTWTPTGSMREARAGHTATQLQDGTVLVAGGTYPDMLVSAEVYHPDTGTWTTAPSMIHARSSGTATLLQDGRVLVTGGTRIDDTLASAELYDPDGGN